jgi:hypothetical protein
MARTIASRRQKASAGRFVGRFAEQQLFRATLRQLAALRDRHDEQLTDDELSYAQIFLIAAEGGMGKTTLLRRFEAIVEENKEAAGAQALYLDWERHTPIADFARPDIVAYLQQCGVAAPEDELIDRFSFVFAQEIERQPHALVKEFLREHLRYQPGLPTGAVRWLSFCEKCSKISRSYARNTGHI